jgi:hypothetical protein
MSYQLTPIGEPTERCGYRIQHVEDTMRDFKGIRVKGEDWYGIFTPEQWARYAELPDDGFRVQMLALGLEVALGIPVVARLVPEGEA